MSVYLRKAELSDCRLLFDWANDEITRANAFSTEPILWDDHEKWFLRMMDDSSEHQFIMMEEDSSVGQIRFSIDQKGTCAEIDYSIDKHHRNSGYGKMIVSLAIQKALADYPSLKKLVAKVKPTNIASLYCFKKNGFEERYHCFELELDQENNTIPSIETCKMGGVSVLFLTNNINTIDLFDWISRQYEYDTCVEIFSGKLSVDYLKLLSPDIVVSYNYNYIISQECIDCVDESIINMHISLLPWNRGFSPNIWSFIDDTPKGVTIHMLSSGLDEGDVLFQKKANFDPDDETFESSYVKLNDMIVDLFKANWDVIHSGEYKSFRKTQEGVGSYHTLADLDELKNMISFEWTDNISCFLKRYKGLYG